MERGACHSGEVINFRSDNAEQWQCCTTLRPANTLILPSHRIWRYVGEVIADTLGHMKIRGPQLFYSFFHTLDESSSYWRIICGLELCFVVFIFNNQCFNFMYCV